MSEELPTITPQEMLRKFTRELPVELNDHELQQYGKMLAEKCKEQELAIDKKKQVVAEHNTRIKIITNEIKRIADARAKGEELRPVMCGEKLHGNVIEIVRLDRMEVVDTRPAELKDLQTEIPGTGMPQIPDGFDEGPRGAQLGSLRDQPVTDEPPGEMTTSSMGDQVFTGGDREDEDDPEGGVGDDEDEDPLEDDHSDDLNCDACGKPVNEGDLTALFEGSTIHASCVPDEDEPPVDGDEASNLVQGYFGTPGQGKGESEEELIDRKLAEREAAEAAPKPGSASAAVAQRDRDIAQRNKEIAEEKSKPKAKRERSKKANAAKKGKKK